jgi:uncharacterized protein involved in exopolysaccharide biosynthesis
MIVELAEYMSRLWRRKWIILGVAVLFALVDIVVFLVLPRHYQATAVLEVGQVNSLLGNPGQGNLISRQSLPSSIQPQTQTYLKLLDSASVFDEAKSKVQTQLGVPAADINFSYSSRGEAETGNGNDLIYIDATSDNAAVAMYAANSLSTVLIEQAQKVNLNAANQFIDQVNKQQIAPIDQKLASVRNESEKLKTQSGGDVAARNARIDELQDQVNGLTDSRKQYSDIIARMQINEALDANSLSVMSPAVVPTSKAAPAFLKTGVVAAVAGLLIGIIAAAVMDRRRSNKTAP